MESGATKGGAGIHAQDRAGKGPGVPRPKFSLWSGSRPRVGARSPNAFICRGMSRIARPKPERELL